MAADGEIRINVIADTQDAENNLNNLSKVGDSLKNIGKAVGASVAAVGTAVVAGTKAIVDATSKTAEYGDNIDKMSQKLGISAEAYQEWDFILQHSGASIEGLQMSMKTLANAAVDGSDSFEALGLSITDVQSMSQEELFSVVIERLQDMGESTERTAIASDLLGRSATELGALLNTSAEDTEAMKQQVHELGGVLSNEAVKNAAAFQDSLQNLKTGISGLGREMTTTFLPTLTQMMDGLTAVVSGDNSGLELINQGINTFVSNLSALIPNMISVGGSIIQSLAGAIMDNIPSLFDTATSIITSLVQFILENMPSVINTGSDLLLSIVNGIANSLPQLIPVAIDAVLTIVDTLINNVDFLIDAAIAIILALADGLINALPKLIEKIPQIITSLLNAIANNLPKIVEMGVTLLVQLATGLIKAIPQLIKSIPQIIKALVNGFKSSMSSIISIGKDIVQGVWQGIQNMVSWFTSKVKSFFSGIVNSVKNALGIHSPSKVFAGIGEYMAEGLGVGWSNSFDDVKEEINSRLNFGTARVSYTAIPNVAKGTIIPQTMAFTSSMAESVPSIQNSSGVNNSDIVSALKTALSDAGVYLDKRKVGNIVFNQQQTETRVKGSSPTFA